MYIPAANRETRLPVLHAAIRDYSFGTLVSRAGGELVASHLPFLLDETRGDLGTLRGHMARANPQWEGFAEANEVLVVFQGPHAYISPAWYATALSVPTWNYVAVHATGTPRVLDDAAAVRELLADTVQAYEASRAAPWPYALQDEYVERPVGGIVGFEISVSRLEGKWKLSQNRPLVDREGALAGLLAEGDPDGVAVSRLMADALAEGGG